MICIHSSSVYQMLYNISCQGKVIDFGGSHEVLLTWEGKEISLGLFDFGRGSGILHTFRLHNTLLFTTTHFPFSCAKKGPPRVYIHTFNILFQRFNKRGVFFWATFWPIFVCERRTPSLIIYFTEVWLSNTESVQTTVYAASTRHTQIHSAEVLNTLSK